ncbi:malate dehydrogenase, mitochondrial, isoform CRA_a [Rattus norvegicus]|uniref:Malate dehydrogenase, mitochondrial, isoform CRA_a n=1 Tax=Rattus norvegicus TaxID=10116 RepID=A6J0A8_RAT|nr:malate dehydrogenase, mitochondrial, isoform CRA_a [Rattus norvegicus]
MSKTPEAAVLAPLANCPAAPFLLPTFAPWMETLYTVLIF